MKRFIKTGMLIAAWSLSGKSHAQQNIQLTQYIFNTLSVNPAYAGYKEEWFAQAGLRSQWAGLDGAPQTGVLSVDGLLDPQGRKLFGAGLQITSDKLGPQTANSAYLNYAFRIRMDQEDTRRLSFGIAVGATQYSLAGDMLSPINPIDKALPPDRITNTVPDARFGIYYSSSKWYFGASLMDMFSGSQNNRVFRWDNTTTDNIRRKPHLYFIAGTLLDVGEDIKLRPSLLVKEDFHGPTSLDVNGMLIFWNRFWIGGGWRTGVTAFEKDYMRVTGNTLRNRNSFSGMVQLYLTQDLRLGYSYDHILSGLANVQHGSHEVTLGVTFGKRYQRVLSPRFF